MDISKLRKYRELTEELEDIRERIKVIRDKQSSIRSTADVQGPPCGGANSDKIGETIATLIDLQELYEKKEIARAREIANIEYYIDKLEPLERRLIRARYIDGETLESVCCIIGYSYRQTRRKHAIAVKKLKEL